VKIRIGKDISIEASADLITKLRKISSMLKDTTKVEFEYDKYFLRCWRVDHGNGKKVLTIQIEEVTL
jgi:hypothetical protein